VDVSVDEWEIYPGDSLVQKIFEEGLKDSEAVIIVLSEHSSISLGFGRSWTPAS
jgi:hypothetical protein